MLGLDRPCGPVLRRGDHNQRVQENGLLYYRSIVPREADALVGSEVVANMGLGSGIVVECDLVENSETLVQNLDVRSVVAAADDPRHRRSLPMSSDEAWYMSLETSSRSRCHSLKYQNQTDDS